MEQEASRGSYHCLPLIKCRPNRRRVPLQGDSTFATVLPARKKGFSPPPATVQPMRLSQLLQRSQVMSSPSFLPRDSVCNSCSQPCPFLSSRGSSPFFSRLAYDSTRACFFANCNSPLFPNKPIFAGITASFLFKVNRFL